MVGLNIQTSGCELDMPGHRDEVLKIFIKTWFKDSKGLGLADRLFIAQMQNNKVLVQLFFSL